MSGTGPGPDDPGWAAPPPAPGGPPPAAPPPEGWSPSSGGWSPPPAPPPPAPGWGPPPGTAPPGTAQHKKGRWLFVLLPLLLVFAVGCGFFAVGLFEFLAEPVDVTNDYLADIRAGRYEEAYARTCTYGSDGTAVPSLTEFVQTQRDLDTRLGRLTSYDITSSNITDDGARTDGTWVRGGREYDVTFRLREEGDHWKVCTPVGIASG